MSRRMISLRVDPELLAEIDAAADDLRMDRTAFLEKGARALLADIKSAEPPAPVSTEQPTQ